MTGEERFKRAWKGVLLLLWLVALSAAGYLHGSSAIGEYAVYMLFFSGGWQLLGRLVARKLWP